MSIISWISPRASEVIFPASMLTSVARSSFDSASSSPNRLTSAPRAGAGTRRQARNASCARVTAASTSEAPCHATLATCPPLIGDTVATSPPIAATSTPHRRAVSSASADSSA